jgi:hypothetical protein
MPRYSIIRSDNAVVVDGEYYHVNCSLLPANVHAIQWDGTKGHVEFVDEDQNDGKRDPNLMITDFAPYASLIEAWQEAKNAAIKAAEIEADVKRTPEAAPSDGSLHVLAD